MLPPAASDKWCFSGELLNIIYTKTGQPEKKAPIFLFGMKTVCTKSQTLAFDLFWLVLRKDKWKWQLQVSLPCSIFPNKSPCSNKGGKSKKNTRNKRKYRHKLMIGCSTYRHQNQIVNMFNFPPKHYQNRVWHSWKCWYEWMSEYIRINKITRMNIRIYSY